MSESLRPHELHHARLPCPLPTPGAYSNSCPSHQWCHETISSSVIPFSSRLQSFPVSGTFPMSQLFASGGQSIGISASASVLPKNIQDWFPLGWAGWISLQSFPTPQCKSSSVPTTEINLKMDQVKCLVTFAAVGLSTFLIALFHNIIFLIIDIIIGLCFYFIISQNSSNIRLSCSLLTILCRFEFWKTSDDADVPSVKLSQWWKIPWRAQSGAELSWVTMLRTTSDFICKNKKAHYCRHSCLPFWWTFKKLFSTK